MVKTGRSLLPSTKATFFDYLLEGNGKLNTEFLNKCRLFGQKDDRTSKNW
jgi:hypothetical protein